MARKLGALFAIVMVISAVVLMCIYLSEVKQWPAGDQGDHFRMAVKHEMALRKGLGELFEYARSHGGKPLLYSLYALPLLRITNSNVLMTISFFCATSYITLLLALTFLFRQFIGQRSSLIAALIIANSPMVFYINTVFMPENLWLAFAMSGLCLASFGMLSSSKLHAVLMPTSFALMALSSLARPVESVITIYPLLASVVIAYLFTQLNQNSDRLRMAKQIAFLSILSVGIQVISVANDYKLFGEEIHRHREFIAIFGQIGLAILIIVIGKQGWGNREAALKARVLIVSIATFSVITSWWYANFGAGIGYWAFKNTFGELALLTDQVNKGRPIFEVFNEMLHSYSGIAPAIVVCMFVAFLMVTLRLRVKRTRLSITETHKMRFLLLVIISSILSTVLFAFAYSNTGTSDPRRSLLSMTILITFALIYVIFTLEKISPILSKIFKATMAVTALGGIVSVLSTIAPDNLSVLVSNLKISMSRIVPVGNYSPPPRTRSFDPQYVEVIRDLGIRRSLIAVYTAAVFDSNRRTFEVETLRFASLLYDDDDHNEYSTCWNFALNEEDEEISSVFKRLVNSGFEYILMDSFDFPFTEPYHRSHLHFYDDINRLLKAKGFDGLKELELIYTFRYGATPAYLFKINKEFLKLDSDFDKDKVC